MAGEQKQRLTIIILSVAISTILMALKFYAYWLTDSAAILSDALESIINVVASGFALWSIIVAARPPDTSHPYGHGKIEYFSAGFEGALIIVASGVIIWEALPAIWLPRTPLYMTSFLPTQLREFSMDRCFFSHHTIFRLPKKYHVKTGSVWRTITFSHPLILPTGQTMRLL